MANSVVYDSDTQTTTLYIDQGALFDHTFTITNKGVPFDCTNWDVRFQFRKKYGSSTAEINGTVANGKIQWVDRPSGVMKMLIQGPETSVIRFDNKDDETLDMVFDVELISLLTTAVYRPVKGAIVLSREVTR